MPEHGGSGQDVPSGGYRLRTIKVDVGQTAGRLPEDDADVLLGPVEVSGRGLGVDPEVLPGVEERTLLAMRDWNRRPAQRDVVADSREDVWRVHRFGRQLTSGPLRALRHSPQDATSP